MAHRLWQAYRGTTAECAAVTPSDGEFLWNTQTDKLYMGDGSTANGLEILMASDVDDVPVDGDTAHPISSNWAFDHVAAADPHAGYVLESLFDAYTMLYADADNTPAALAIAASRIVGRKAAGGIAAMTGAEVLALLTAQASAAFSWNNQNLTSVGTINTHTIPAGTDTFCLLNATQELDNKTLDSSVLKGTFTNSGTVILPAFTTGGTITLSSSGKTIDAGASYLRINTTGGGDTLRLYATNTGIYGTSINCYHVSTSPAADDMIFSFGGYGYDLDTPQNSLQYGVFYFLIEDATADHADGKFEIDLLADQTNNRALTLSSVGLLAVDLGGSGTAAQVDLFDSYDDALALRQGIQQNNRELLADMGVLTRKDTGSGYMMNLQPMVRLLAGGIYQTRQQLDDLKTELLDRLDLVEHKLSLLN